ncbi:MAG: T9SS type A sorting domain-containing protein [Chitinophagales bacterium]
MKKLFCVCFIVVPFISHEQGTWIQKQEFEGTARGGAVAFSINGKGYLGTGGDLYGLKKDFWLYDPGSDSWTQQADFGGEARYLAAAFAVGSKGYIGTGRTDGYHVVKDFWEYDPATNAWTQRADFPGGPREAAVAFSIASYGYLGTGNLNNGSTIKRNFWRFNPAADQWTQIADYGGPPITGAIAFATSTNGYVTTGNTGLTGLNKELWEYDPGMDQWNQKADFPGYGRTLAAAFSIDNFGYLTTGTIDSIIYDINDFWKYDIQQDAWTQLNDFPGVGRSAASTFVIDTSGYVVAGSTHEPEGKELWQYTPANSCTAPNAFSSSVIPQSAKLQWNSASQQGYVIRYKVQGNSSWVKVRSNDTVKTLHNLLPQTTYLWEVKSVCGTNPVVASEWSALQSFTTLPQKLSAAQAAQPFGVYPNPVAAVASVMFYMPVTAQVELKVFELTGKIVSSKSLGELQSGNQSLTFDRSSLPEGIYLLQILSGNQTFSQKIVIE